MRRDAREVVYMLVFEYNFNREIDEEKLSELLVSKDYTLSKEDVEYIKKVYYGVINNYAFLNEVIEKWTVKFRVDRIFKTDISILLLAVYEILFEDDIPDVVSVNEAVLLAQKFSTKKSSAFINGVLAIILKNKDEIEVSK